MEERVVFCHPGLDPGSDCHRVLKQAQDDSVVQDDTFFLLVGVRGFEPPTFWSQTRRATRLRYTPTMTLYTLIFSREQGTCLGCSPFEFYTRPLQ